MNIKYSIISLAFCIIQFSLYSQDRTSSDYWDELHYALKYKVDKNFDEPAHKAPLEEYLYWIRKKGEDLKEVNEAFQELNVLYNNDPDNEVYKVWMNKFYYLVLNAEGSGNSTVTGAVMTHMRQECISYSRIYVWIVRNIGRPIYAAAIESGFDPTSPIERSNCLINCAIKLLESDRYGFSLYRNRERVYGYFDEEGILNDDNLDFVSISCVRRGRFSVNVEGEPAKELTYAFENIGEIMDECDWWSFSGERQDAEDLLVQYYKDALCKKPPHHVDMGHKFYRELAEERNIKEAVDYNNGFYGILYGKVEIKERGEKKPAPGAKVVVQTIDERWETNADENGNYQFDKVILHKHCSPFNISAEFEGDRVDTKYEGELLEPDPNKKQEKDLLIIRSTEFAWKGSIDLQITQTFNCDVEEPTGDLSTKRILAGDHKTTFTNIAIGLSDFNLPATGTSAGAKLQYISGQVTVVMNEDHTIDGSSEKTQCHNDGTGRWEWVSPGNWNTWHETMTGQAYADIEDGGITLLITKEMLGDKKAMDNMQQQVAEMQAKLQDALNSMDKQAMEKMKSEMRNTLEGDQNDATVPIKAVINISMGAKNYPVYTSRERKAFNVCTGEFEENESTSETIEMPLILPIGTEMKGEYTRGKNGNDRIEVTINETKLFHPTFGSGTSCPEGTITINGSITLERNKN